LSATIYEGMEGALAFPDVTSQGSSCQWKGRNYATPMNFSAKVFIHPSFRLLDLSFQSRPRQASQGELVVLTAGVIYLYAEIAKSHESLAIRPSY
jgi:hypothetical protein